VAFDKDPAGLWLAKVGVTLEPIVLRGDVAHPQGEVGAGLRELPEVSGVQPAALKQPHALASEHPASVYQL
jgi:hypothetical protein